MARFISLFNPLIYICGRGMPPGLREGEEEWIILSGGEPLYIAPG